MPMRVRTFRAAAHQRGFWRVGWRVGLLALLAGCVALRELDFVTGECAEALERCQIQECAQVVDPRPCEEECAFEARRCERRQGTEGRPRARLGADQAALVDLRGAKLRHSSTLQVVTGGAVQAGDGHHTLAPGAFLRIELTLPPGTRNAEVALTHRPGGAPCYLTLTAGSGTLLGRYQPPATPRMKAELFDFSRYLPQVAAGAPVPVTLTLFNNDVAGSQAPYHLAEVQVFYQAMEPPRSP